MRLIASGVLKGRDDVWNPDRVTWGTLDAVRSAHLPVVGNCYILDVYRERRQRARLIRIYKAVTGDDGDRV